MTLTQAEQEVIDKSVAYAREYRTRIARRLADQTIYPPEAHPVSVFMAGSPGAGKTEASIELLAAFGASSNRVLRIDPDELREQFPQYSGSNSWLFQRAVSMLVERIHDRALRQKQSFLLDGTFSSYSVAQKNVHRSIERDRLVQILYVYQKPELAWEFVQARELAEGRRIEPDTFLRQYFGARETVNRLKLEFGSEIQVDLLLKNNDGSHRSYKAGVDRIDNHIPEKYSVADVQALLGIESASDV